MEFPVSDIDNSIPQYPMEEKPKRSSMFITIGKWIVGIVFILTLASLAIGYLFEDKIKARLITVSYTHLTLPTTPYV